MNEQIKNKIRKAIQEVLVNKENNIKELQEKSSTDKTKKAITDEMIELGALMYKDDAEKTIMLISKLTNNLNKLKKSLQKFV